MTFIQENLPDVKMHLLVLLCWKLKRLKISLMLSMIYRINETMGIYIRLTFVLLSVHLKLYDFIKHMFPSQWSFARQLVDSN